MYSDGHFLSERSIRQPCNSGMACLCCDADIRHNKSTNMKPTQSGCIDYIYVIKLLTTEVN